METTIEQEYHKRVQMPSDINELLPDLYNYASECTHITEMGVRNPTSTYAFLYGLILSKGICYPNRIYIKFKLVSYDIGRYPEVDLVEQLAKNSPVDFQFILQDVLVADIEETDFLFLDTFHTATQLEKELALHANKVRRFIGFHDTTTFWENGEPSYESVQDKGTNCGRGLKYALEPFLEAHPEWKVILKREYNNGLTIIERQP